MATPLQPQPPTPASATHDEIWELMLQYYRDHGAEIRDEGADTNVDNWLSYVCNSMEVVLVIFFRVEFSLMDLARIMVDADPSFEWASNDMTEYGSLVDHVKGQLTGYFSRRLEQLIKSDPEFQAIHARGEANWKEFRRLAVAATS